MASDGSGVRLFMGLIFVISMSHSYMYFFRVWSILFLKVFRDFEFTVSEGNLFHKLMILLVKRKNEIS